MEYVASLSYGKDSLAMLHVIRDVLAWPLDRIITVDTWATDTLLADWPDVVCFKAYADGEIRRRWGLKVEHLASTDKRGRKWTFERLFHQARKRGNRPGENIGWPMISHCWANSRLKMNAIRQMEVMTAACQHYIGIAADEPKRIAHHAARPGILMPLVTAGWTEPMCREWCEREGLLSPTYSYAARSGCFFCAEQPLDQLRVLRDKHPDLWALMLRWDAESPRPFKASHHAGHPGRTLREIEERFTLDDRGALPKGHRFHWARMASYGAQMTMEGLGFETVDHHLPGS